MSEESDDIIVNDVDGLPRFDNEVGRNLLSRMDSSFDDTVSDENLPTSLIVTNLDLSIFFDDELKAELESIFKEFGEVVSSQYFRSFRRVRLVYSDPSSAAKARVNLHQTLHRGCVINCYFAQPVTPIDSADMHLQLPAPVKQFLISPPASPPIGWKPREEAEPLINYDLVAALAKLTPGTKHELLPPDNNYPGIVVHVCEEVNQPQNKPVITQTACPSTK